MREAKQSLKIDTERCYKLAEELKQTRPSKPEMPVFDSGNITHFHHALTKALTNYRANNITIAKTAKVMAEKAEEIVAEIEHVDGSFGRSLEEIL